MFDKLTAVEQRYDELLSLLGTAQVQSDPSEFRKHAKAAAEIETIVERFREYKTVIRDLTQAEELAASGDADMRELAAQEVASLAARRDALLAELKILLIPKDPNDERNVRAQAETKPRFLPRICFACTAGMRNGRDGGSK
jgi:peptide chain release factor 1